MATGGASMHLDLEKSASRPPSVPEDLLASEADAELLGKFPTFEIMIGKLFN